MKPATLLAGILRQCAIDEGGVRALARAVPMSHQSLHDLVNGRRRPSRLLCIVLAQYLNVSPGEVAEWAVTPGDP